MVTAETKMKLATSLMLLSVIEQIIWDKDRKPRTMPFRLQYRLTRTHEQLRADYDKYTSGNLFLMAKFGHANADDTGVEFTDEERAEYEKHLDIFLQGTVSHKIMTVEPEDLITITEHLDINPDALRTFVRMMTNDPELQQDLEQEITPIKVE